MQIRHCNLNGGICRISQMEGQCKSWNMEQTYLEQNKEREKGKIKFMTILRGTPVLYPVVEKAQMMPHSTDTWKWFQYSPCDGACEIIKRNSLGFLLEVPYVCADERLYLRGDILLKISSLRELSYRTYRRF